MVTTRRDFEDIVIRLDEEGFKIKNILTSRIAFSFFFFCCSGSWTHLKGKGHLQEKLDKKMKNLQPCEVVHRDELKEGGIDEEHANKVPPKPGEKCHI